MPSSIKKVNVESSTIMDVILIKSIENTYIAPILKEMNLCIEVNNSLLWLLFVMDDGILLYMLSII